MSELEFIEFIEGIGIKKNPTDDISYKYREYVSESRHNIYQIVYLLKYGAISTNISIVNENISNIKDKMDGLVREFHLSDPDLKEKIIEEFLDFYVGYGIIPDNLKPFVRDRKIKLILD